MFLVGVGEETGKKLESVTPTDLVLKVCGSVLTLLCTEFAPSLSVLTFL